MRESASQVDLLVIGGGMAGLSAAAYAARNGAGVVLLRVKLIRPYPQGAVRDTLREFNEQCRTGQHSPGRKLDAAPLVDPPCAYAGGLASALVFGPEAARTAITDRAVVS